MPPHANAAALLDVAQMSEADRLSAAFGLPGIVLMENAGAAVADVVQRFWPQGLVVVLCGRGNNGGDGFVCARLLVRAGRRVRLALLGDRDGLKGDARHHSELWQGEVQALEPGVVQDADVVVDALLGSGLRRPLSGAVLTTLEAAHARAVPIVAVDVPSGLAGDTGASLGAVSCAVTVTFFRKKPGHLLQPGRTLCGRIVVADIGTPDAVWDTITPMAFENTPDLWRGATADQPFARSATAGERNPGVSTGVLAFARMASQNSGGIVIVREGDGVGGIGPLCVGSVHAARFEWNLASESGPGAVVIAAADGRVAITPPEHLPSTSGSMLLPETADLFFAVCKALYR
jgi:hydroxyethylthiazole kinase-like uncharacterized protein yjeF